VVTLTGATRAVGSSHWNVPVMGAGVGESRNAESVAVALARQPPRVRLLVEIIRPFPTTTHCA
jgi:hypothetical protein